MYINPSHCTVKHDYSEHPYIELKLTVKRFSFPMTLLHIVNLKDITNYVYNEVKSPVPGTSL